jgi:penicillin G amidase
VPTSPFKGVWGPVYRMLADLGDPSRSRWQVSTGQSGQPGSPHYDDMIEGWRTAKANSVYLDERHVRAAGHAKQLRLDPD